MTPYTEEQEMTQYLVARIIPMTIKPQVETMLFMEEMEMTIYMLLVILRFMEKVVMIR